MYHKEKRERNQEIIRKYNEGVSYVELAKEYNLSRQRIQQIVVRPDRSKHVQTFDDAIANSCTNRDLIKAIIYRSGMTEFEVASRIGIGFSTFSNKLSGRNEFKCGEMRALKKLLNMTDYEFAYIFLR